ncbi:type III-B CRISPR module RAMP protein Cmr4 [Candidatus Electronema sp. JC]|uniref:type III-B CRISPR module RAMP protein Cmr4 n=1 Tax=Candidatus Electronema sp. JC TaxID=3401570 RepID=UPI003B439C54
MLHKLLYLTAVSPVHNGSGQGLGAIDNPIMRQRDTNLPIIQGSSIKGVLRTEWEPDSTRKSILFGPEPKTASDDNSAHAGALCVGDAQLLFFPIRSLRGAFVWATSPLTLALYQKLLMFAGIEMPSLDILLNTMKEKEQFLVCPKGLSELKADSKHIFLEEYGYDAPKEGEGCQELEDFAEKMANIVFPATYPPFLKDKFKKHLVVLPEDDFQYFITFATEVTANIRIGDSGATTDGSLRYTEYLLSQSVLCSLWSIDKGRGSKAKDANMETADSVWAAVDQLAEENCRVQIGGDATVGKGLMEMKFHK